MAKQRAKENNLIETILKNCKELIVPLKPTIPPHSCELLYYYSHTVIRKFCDILF